MVEKKKYGTESVEIGIESITEILRQHKSLRNNLQAHKFEPMFAQKQVI